MFSREYLDPMERCSYFKIQWKGQFVQKIIFTLVDRNISIMGCCSFAGNGCNYELDLYDCSDEKNPRSMQRLFGTLIQNELLVGGIFQLTFANGVPVKPNVKYALACRTSTNLARYGYAGLASVNGPDGTKFDFTSSTCFNSNRGYNTSTSTNQGHLPQILYGIETGKQIQVSFKSCELTTS